MSNQPSYFYKLFPQLQLIEEQLPSEIELPHIDKSIPVFTMDCGSRVCYRMHQGRAREPSTVKANFKIPKQCPIYYFEVLIDDMGSGGSVCLGLIPASYHFSRLIGHDRGYGFTVDDGKKHFDGTQVADETRKCVRGETVGIGINYISRTIFFTKDGEFLGEDFKNIKGDEFYPAVSLHSPGANLIFNFGRTPFLFNFELHIYVC
uniref:Ran-binding protein 10 (Trinotate prediction) n=1 Tax=Myxobolus squamalis TaxID=59785 RepID=A0A6B2G128_MYXSQ